MISDRHTLRPLLVHGARKAVTSLCLAGTLLSLLFLLYASWCAFSWGKYVLFDHGMYTNMIWNSGHGEPFKVLVDRSYLRTHLSYSLALIGPLFRLWDHPFLLGVCQWLLLVGGALIIWRTAVRLGLQFHATAAVLFFYTGYVFTQRTLLSEFHGLTTYHLLVPWLYYGLRFRKNMMWLPLLLILGVREDAFLFILPMLFYFAVKDRWKAGYAWGAVAVLYGAIALTVLFPYVNGFTVFARRQESLGVQQLLGTWDAAGLRRRGAALALAVLPMLPFLHRRATALWLFPSVALLTCLLSGFSRQHGLLNHYPPPVMTTLTVGILESLACSIQAFRSGKIARSADTPVRALLLVIITLAAHLWVGFLPFGAKNRYTYSIPNPDLLLLLDAARHVPRDGVLVTSDRLAGACANRRDIYSWRQLHKRPRDVDLVLAAFNALPTLMDGEFVEGLRQGSFGVVYGNSTYVVLQRGYNPAENKRALDFLEHGDRSILVAETRRHGGGLRRTLGGRLVRYWEGDGSRGPINLSYGGAWLLQPGSYALDVEYRAKTPRRTVRDSWGRFSVHRLNMEAALAEAEIDRIETPGREFRKQTLLFEVAEPAMIEFRATGADARLWIHRATFRTLMPPPARKG